MKQKLYSVLLGVLTSLVSLKRGIKFLLLKTRITVFRLDELVRNTIGFRLYALQKKIGRSATWLDRLRDGRIVEFLGERRTLQVVLLIVIGIIFYPHSKLYTQSSIQIIPGRATLLYAVVGPGDLEFDLEEIVVADGVQFTEKDTRSYKEGAVARDVDGSNLLPEGTKVEPLKQIAAISAGGSALIKPIIDPGGLITRTVTSPGEVDKSKKEIIRYVVQSGDVLGTIATQFGVSVETIMWSNDLNSRSIIRPGDELAILPVSGIVHRVKSGDTLGRISRLYNAEVGDIMKENEITSGSVLSIGQELVIPGGRRIAAAPVRRAPSNVVTTPSSRTTPPPSSSSAPASSGYIWPTSVRTITQYYGWRHTGVDIAGPIGSPLYASRAGRVTKSQCGWNGGYGCYIIVDHGDGINTLYAHASELYVSVGQQVTQGQTIALMGSTGRSTGPHIHFEVRSGSTRLNPFKYVR